MRNILLKQCIDRALRTLDFDAECDALCSAFSYANSKEDFDLLLSKFEEDVVGEGIIYIANSGRLNPDGDGYAYVPLSGGELVVVTEWTPTDKHVVTFSDPKTVSALGGYEKSATLVGSGKILIRLNATA